MTPDRCILTPEDITSLTSPLFQSPKSDITNVVRSFLGRDRVFFDRVERQLLSMLRVWHVIVEQKKRHDSLQGLGIPTSRETLEAFLLCGRLIPARAMIIPEEAIKVAEPPRVAQPPRIAQQPSAAPSRSVAPRRILDIDVTDLQLKQLEAPTASSSNRSNKRTFSNMQGHTRHEDETRKRMK